MANKKTYEIEIAKYEQKYGKIIKEKKSIPLDKDSSKEVAALEKQIQDLKLPERPKKPLTQFFLYKDQKIEELKKQNPTLKYAELLKMIGENYAQISESEKTKLDAKYKQTHDSY